jgi:uncharacterized protein (DUF111 family)
VTVRAICEAYHRPSIVETILRESTSIGVRYFPVERQKLDRRIERVKTPFGSVRIKVSEDKRGKIRHVAPEYEDCRRLGLKAKTPVMAVYQEALLAARKARDSS